MAREAKKESRRVNWRLVLAAIGLGAAGVSTAMAAYQVRRFVFTDPQFQFSRGREGALTIVGLQYASRARVLRTFTTDFNHSVFAIPLAERRRRLLAIDWVEDASISRIWPDRLVVHIRERKPVAFVFFRSGVLLIDPDGVLLEPPAQAQFTFPVLSGVGEDETEVQRRARVGALLEVEHDLGALATDVSEVNAGDLENIQIVAQVNHHTMELALGDTNFARRYQNFVNHYPEILKRSPEVKMFDLRLDDRITAKQ
ncbi:MAG TPA: FtsQ-type POTRA domain-containing protein [Bryobacteraceae bacterium]|nr:FtsQ-type POTRA domain-containing protein [Bryobacteraceae bacterium]